MQTLQAPQKPGPAPTCNPNALFGQKTCKDLWVQHNAEVARYNQALLNYTRDSVQQELFSERGTYEQQLKTNQQDYEAKISGTRQQYESRLSELQKSTQDQIAKIQADNSSALQIATSKAQTSGIVYGAGGASLVLGLVFTAVWFLFIKGRP